MKSQPVPVPAIPSVISDAGKEMELRDKHGVVTSIIPRYGVWVYDIALGRHQVAECSNDAGALAKKYHVKTPPRPITRAGEDVLGGVK